MLVPIKEAMFALNWTSILNAILFSFVNEQLVPLKHVFPVLYNAPQK